jgi:predicted class III extradiol MEMO1 family dioxygenase
MDRPKLRKVERATLERGDEHLLVLRDPLELADPFAIDSEFAPVLDLLDGQRTLAQVRQSLLMRQVLDIPVEDLEAFAEQLAESGWLEGQRFEALWQDMHELFMEQDAHPATRAGVLYGAEQAELREQLRQAVPASGDRAPDRAETLGLATPYLPIDLTSSILRDTLRHLPDPNTLDLLILLGTDHTPGLLPFAATDRPHATALGSAPLAGRLIAALDQQLDWILREEIRHRRAPALEFANLLILAAYGDACPPVLSIACGQSLLGSADGEIAGDEFFAAMEVLLPQQGRVLVWASAELGHLGTAYGGVPLDDSAKEASIAREQACLQPLLAGQADRFQRACMDDFSASDRPSGAAALTTLARLMPAGFEGEMTGYKSVRPPGPGDGHAGAVGLAFKLPE